MNYYPTKPNEVWAGIPKGNGHVGRWFIAHTYRADKSGAISIEVIYPTGDCWFIEPKEILDFEWLRFDVPDHWTGRSEAIVPNKDFLPDRCIHSIQYVDLFEKRARLGTSPGDAEYLRCFKEQLSKELREYGYIFS